MNAAPSTVPTSLQVEVLIYSGRPNPVFTITDPAEINEITALVNAMPKNSATDTRSPSDQSVLGYKGIVVGNLSAASPDLESMVVIRSNVHVKRKSSAQAKAPQVQSAAASSATAAAAPAASAESSEFRLDGGNILENRLLGMARNRGVINDALLTHINSTK